MEELGRLDYVAIIIYMLIMAGMGMSLGFFVKNVGDYFSGGNTIPWYVGGISNFMSLFSAFVFVAHASVAYEHGMVALLLIWCAVPATIFGALLFAKIWRRAGISSPVEFLEIRFSALTRQVFSWGGIGFRVLDNMVRLYAIGVFVAAATPLSLETAILGGGVIVVLYTVVGGLWAVVMTDIVQFVVLITAAIILVPLSLSEAGGFSTLVSQQPDHFSFFNGPKGEFFFLAVYYVMFAIKNNGNWAFIQRFYSVRDEKAGKKMGLLTAALFFVFPIFFLIPAIAASTVIPDLENSEMAYVAMALKLLPSGIMGILLAAMFAATMSSLDSDYNVISNVITKDIYQRVFKPAASDKELMWVARLSTLCVGGLVIGGALFVGRFGGAFDASKLFTGLFAIPLVVPVFFGVLLRKANAQGALWSLILGVSTGLILNFLPEVSWESATLLTIVVCIVVFMSSAFWARSRKHEKGAAVVNDFFDKLTTPVSDQEKQDISIQFKVSLLKMFGLSLLAVGILFISMSIPSIPAYSAQLTMGGGVVCLISALGAFLLVRNLERSKEAKEMKLAKVER